ncbi:MAG: hypothetical protein ACLTZI_10795 [[Eubacterium] siraeum]
MARRFAGKDGRLCNDHHKCTVMIGGDITVSAEMQKNAAKGMPVFDEAFSSLGGIFGSFDFSVVMLDTDINDKKAYTFEDSRVINCPSTIADAVCKSGIDALAVNAGLLRESAAVARKVSPYGYNRERLHTGRRKVQHSKYQQYKWSDSFRDSEQGYFTVCVTAQEKRAQSTYSSSARGMNVIRLR